MGIQARIPAALAAIHNFISIHDPRPQYLPDGPNGGGGTQEDSDNADDDTDLDPPPMEREDNNGKLRRDEIAQAMWDDYMHVCEERGIGLFESSSDDSGDAENSNEDNDDMEL